jgi:predicted MPP superfamily phosphohydrolase
MSVFGMWIVIHSFRYFSIDIPIPLIGFFTVILALCLSGYGIYHAKDTIIKNISVKIKNLPQYWQNKKIALISDVHIGHINRAKYLRNIVKMINTENVELLCIA